jgi:hypothetical protein
MQNVSRLNNLYSMKQYQGPILQYLQYLHFIYNIYKENEKLKLYT